MKNRDTALSETPATEVRKNSIGWMVKSLSAKLDKEMKKDLEPHGLNLGQFAILMTLLEKDNVTQTAIGKKVSMLSYAITRNIDVLEKNGLLERHESTISKRSLCIRLTVKGKALAPVLFSIVGNINKNTFSILDEGEEKQFKLLLEKVLF
ncbi:MAG: MarR family transcriptional regulator [Gammaproteobacteria bacterium]|nr:MarR family transcriptional regulator [Gammaproteobacteria bacterium]